MGVIIKLHAYMIFIKCIKSMVSGHTLEVCPVQIFHEHTMGVSMHWLPSLSTVYLHTISLLESATIPTALSGNVIHVGLCNITTTYFTVAALIISAIVAGIIIISLVFGFVGVIRYNITTTN